MAAGVTFSSIINEIQESNLNFKINLSPFSATIILKKTAVTNSQGISAMTSLPSFFLLQQAQKEIVRLSHGVFSLRSANEKLRTACEASMKNCEESDEDIKDLKYKLNIASVSVGMKESLMLKVKETESELDSANMLNKRLEKSVNKCNLKLAETSNRLLKEKSESEKYLKKDIKEWKKELGNERRHKINLKNGLDQEGPIKVKNPSTLVTPVSKHSILNPSSPPSKALVAISSINSEIECTICAKPIPNYKAKLFSESELNPACKICRDTAGDISTEDDDTDEAVQPNVVIQELKDNEQHSHIETISFNNKFFSSNNEVTILPSTKNISNDFPTVDSIDGTGDKKRS